MAQADEDIFLITDHTQYTDFEALAASIELYLRHTGFSADFRTHTAQKVSKNFKLGECKFSCFHAVSRRERAQRSESGEPLCLAEMRDGLPNFYPFGEHILMGLFGITEFLVVQGGKIPASEELAILSAFAVGAQNAKCALPFFITRTQSGNPRLQIQGLLLFPGYFASFEVWEQRTSEPLGFKPTLEFFLTNVEPGAANPKASVFAAYHSTNPRFQSVDGIAKLTVYCRWATRPAEEIFALLRGEEFDCRQCESFRICMRLNDSVATASDCLLQLTQKEVLGEVVLDSDLSSDLQELDVFEDLLLTLAGAVPVFPLTSFWTKKAMQLIYDNNFTPPNVASAVGALRDMVQRKAFPPTSLDDFKHFDECSETHRQTLVTFSAAQSLARIHQTYAGDPGARLAFLHNSPAHFPEQTLLDPASRPLYNEGMLLRVLKAYLLDMYMKEGFQPTITQFIQWHRESLAAYAFYRTISAGLDDGKMLELWQTATSKSFADTTSFVVNELTKEVEMALQTLESSESAQDVIGMGLSAVLAIIFRNQMAMLTGMHTGPLAPIEVKELVRPAFADLRKACKSLSDVGALHAAVKKLELTVTRAFSLTLKFSESKGLTARLMRENEIEVTRESERQEVAELLRSLKPTDLWQTHTVLRTPSTRFACVAEAAIVKLAVARVEKETES